MTRLASPWSSTRSETEHRLQGPSVPGSLAHTGAERDREYRQLPRASKAALKGPLRASARGLIVVALATRDPATASTADSAVSFRECSSLQSTAVRVGQRVSISLDMGETLDLMVVSGQRCWTVMDEGYKSDGLALEPPAKYSFAVNDLRGRYWDASGRAVEGRVFAAPGAYALYFADSLETEPGNTLHCPIRIEVVEP